MPTAQEKTCVVCGENCADRPRVKDPKGRYYCKPCYAQLSEQQHQTAPAPPAPGDMPLEPQPGEAGIDDHGGLLSELIESAPASTGKTCPQCNTELDQQAVLCVSCGYNFQSGEALQMNVQKAKTSRSGAVWPVVIGVISLIIAIGGIGWNVLDFALSVGAGPPMASDDPSFSAGYSSGMVARTVILILLSLWLLFAAIRVLQQKQSGVSNMRAWAKAKIVLASFSATCLVALLIVGNSAIPEEEIPGGMEMLVVYGILALALFISWPIFVLIWFRRDAIEQQVAQWD